MTEQKRKLLAPEMQKELQSCIKRIMPESLYDEWAEDFIFLRLDAKKMVVGYTGKSSLRTFKKEYKDVVWMYMCASLGTSEKFVVKKRRRKKTEER